MVGRLRHLRAQSDRPRKKRESENLTNLNTRKPQSSLQFCRSDYINILKGICSRVRDVVACRGRDINECRGNESQLRLALDHSVPLTVKDDQGFFILAGRVTDAGVNHTVLSEFRTRLVEGKLEWVLLDVVLERVQALGLLKRRGKQRTDSTLILAAIRTMNRLERVGETLHATLNAWRWRLPNG